MISDRIYLDYNATSPLSSSVVDWLKSGELFFANPASQHHAGKASLKSINGAREDILSTFGRSSQNTHLLFHSGATEGIVTFAHSFSEWTRRTNRPLLICYSRLDHPAVLSLKDQFWGAHVGFFELKMNGDLGYEEGWNFSELQKMKNSQPDLVILYHHLWVHNETGVVSPLETLLNFKLIKDLFIHVDAVQAPGKVPDWMDLAGGDIFTFSPHKFGSLKGIGWSFFPEKMPFFPFIQGGGQQNKWRAGTENSLGVKSISLALSDLKKIDVAQTSLSRLRLLAFLKEALLNCGGVISSGGNAHNSNTLYFYFSDYSSDIMLALFDLNGMMISAGSACSSGAAKESEVMLHLGLKKVARNGLRLSLPFHFTHGDCLTLEAKMSLVFSKLPKLSKL